MIAILDIGKTNKKCFVFDEDYRIVSEESAQLPETTDEDGDPCEDVKLLEAWVLSSVEAVLRDKNLDVRAFHCSAYGASFVCLDKNGRPLFPLYNYLKPFPEALQQRFFEGCGGAEKMALETASPVLGHLNSGLQLYRLKHQKPADFEQVEYALHLPQYTAGLVSGRVCSDLTSIGCHTMLWDFSRNDYHDWVAREGILSKLAPIEAFDTANHVVFKGKSCIAGVGLHDSSAALIPYLESFREPFVLISTGTWNITLNPFNDAPLTPAELAQDCLCYLTPAGKPVKAARLFAGFEHEQLAHKIAADYRLASDFYKNWKFALKKQADIGESGTGTTASFTEETKDRAESKAKLEYLRGMEHLVRKQVASTRLVLGAEAPKRIFVDGGFSKNELFMQLLADAFPETEVYASEVAQATALGAAMALHGRWNSKEIPQNLIALKRW
jgi:sugar (pentulose or hexulose) kinase